MKTARKVLILTLCAALLVSASVMGTIAYLTGTDKVDNTFTVGKLAMTLDEADVDVYGIVEKDADGNVLPRVKTNEYKLVPGHNYTKDPTLHFAVDSEAAYLFVKVENGIAAIEAEGTTTIASQIKANGWIALEGVENVYYKEAPANLTDNTVDDYVVFESFTVADNADVSGYGEAKITVTGYAVQQDGFDSAIDAWNATFGATAAN